MIRLNFVRWLKFNAVGLIGVGVQLAALAFFRSLLGWGIRVATLTAVECAVLHNFVWHERWTWIDRTRKVRGRLQRLLRFNTANGLISLKLTGARVSEVPWQAMQSFLAPPKMSRDPLTGAFAMYALAATLDCR